MTDFTAPADRSAGLNKAVPVASLQRLALWLLVFVSFIAIIEPSPYEVMFVVTAFVFAVTGIRFSRGAAPLMMLLLLYNLGGVTALIPVIHDRDALTFVIISCYLAVTSVFFAGILADDTQARLHTIRRAWVGAAVFASIAGILGYADIGGLGELFSRYGTRASGTFKDPNVLGPFLVPPAVMMIQNYLVGEQRRPLLSLALLVTILAGIFLSFSRGAWGTAAAAVLMTAGLTFLTTRHSRIRARIITLSLLGIVIFAILIAIALSIDSVRSVFEQRFSLDQSYDVGETGRFGNQMRAISRLLTEPLGFGPLRFRFFYPEDPHNVYVNAFASYGWLGGLSYFALMAATIWIGWSMIWKQTPWQSMAIAFWSATFMTILQGVQIDTDHWRHFYLLIGATWGIAIATARYEAQQRMQRDYLRTITQA